MENYHILIGTYDPNSGETLDRDLDETAIAFLKGKAEGICPCCGRQSDDVTVPKDLALEFLKKHSSENGYYVARRFGSCTSCQGSSEIRLNNDGTESYVPTKE